MSLHREDRELQIRLTELQIKQQHIASVYTVALAIEFSILTSYAVLFLTGLRTENVFVIAGTVISMIGTSALAVITLRLYSRHLDRLKTQIEELKREFLW